jgi:hypothetical protein
MEIFSSSNSEFLKLVKSSSARKAKADKWLQYYHEQQSEETLRLIKQRWSRPETFRVFQVNAVKKVINKRANLYRLAPGRLFIDIDQAAGDELYRSAKSIAGIQTEPRSVRDLVVIETMQT